jgi:hypothetical protein
MRRLATGLTLGYLLVTAPTSALGHDGQPRCRAARGERIRLRAAGGLISERRLTTRRGRVVTITGRVYGCSQATDRRTLLGTSRRAGIPRVIDGHYELERTTDSEAEIKGSENEIKGFDVAGNYVTFAVLTLRAANQRETTSIEEYDLATSRPSFDVLLGDGDGEGEGLITLDEELEPARALIPVAPNGFAAWRVSLNVNPDSSYPGFGCFRFFACEEIVAHDSAGTHVVASDFPPDVPAYGAIVLLTVTDTAVLWSYERAEAGAVPSLHRVPLS